MCSLPVSCLLASSASHTLLCACPESAPSLGKTAAVSPALQLFLRGDAEQTFIRYDGPEAADQSCESVIERLTRQAGGYLKGCSLGCQHLYSRSSLVHRAGLASASLSAEQEGASWDSASSCPPCPPMAQRVDSVLPVQAAAVSPCALGFAEDPGH